MDKFDYSKQDLVLALEKVGLKKGDSIFCHSNIGFFGKLKDAKNSQDYYQNIKSAVFEVIGHEGTFVVPTFSYSFCNKTEFDPEKTLSVCGILSEMLRKDPEAIRSQDAIFSVAAVGVRAKEFCEKSSNHFLGDDGFCARFLKAKGKFCNFNFDAGSTFIHYVERCLKVPYRVDKAFEGDFISKGNKEKRTYFHYVFDHAQKQFYPDFTKFDLEMRKRGLLKSAKVGKGSVVCVSAKDTFDVIEEKIKEDPYFLTLGEK